MAGEVEEGASRLLHLLLLFPLVYRPEKPNFAPRFVGLSERARGAIFTLSGKRRRAEPIGRFLFYANPDTSNPFRRFLRFLAIQVCLPLRLFWRRKQTDCVVAYDPYACGVAGVVLKCLLRAKLIVEINGDFHELTPGARSWKALIKAAALRLSLRSADAIKVLNTSQERFFHGRYPGKPIFRFPDFTPDGFFRALKTEEGDYLLSVGHPFALKGVGELIQAFQMIAGRHPWLKLRIMGYSPPHELERYRELSGNDPRIEFVPPGWVEEVGEQIRSCFALVAASHFEAGGRVLFEAMACGKPVVASKTNGPSDYIEDGKTGLLCEVRNVTDLAGKLDYLAQHPELARALGQAGFERVTREFSETQYQGMYFAMLETIIHGRRP